MNYFSRFTLNNRVCGAAFLLFVVTLLLVFIALLLPLPAQAGEANAADDVTNDVTNNVLTLDPVKNNSSPNLDPVSQELKKKSGRLRFRDGPLCLCADGLQESDIKKAQQARNTSGKPQNGNDKNANSSAGE